MASTGKSCTTVKPSTTAAAVNALTTVEPSTTEPSPSHHRPRVESPTHRTRSGVNAVRVSAARGVVGTRSPGADIGSVKRVVEMSAVERSAINQAR
jgi:hypothetical protein